MDIVGSTVSVLNLLLAPLGRVFYNLRHLQQRQVTMHRTIEELLGKKNDLIMEIDAAMVYEKKKLKSEVQLWLKNVEQVTSEVSSIETEINEKARCIRGCFPNCGSRYKLGKLLTKIVTQVSELQAKAAFGNGLFVDSLPDTVRILPTTALVGNKTPQNVLHVIWECLVDANVSKVGVYGMGGIGKTTIMMHVNNLLSEAQIFDVVIWVTVSKTFNLKKMQSDIANALNLELFEDENVIWRSTRIFEHLQKKKYILILDDLWHRFSLEEVGIPQPNRENGCKFVLITRLLEVCRGMETQREIKLEFLSKEEAWILFIEKADAILSPDIESTARILCEECGGLPLAIITIGRAMRKIADIRVWKNALEELKSSRAEIEGMKEDVFARLKFSYDHLMNDQVRDCFLYCTLYPEDCKISVEEIIEYWMAEGLITEVGDRESEINKGYAVLNELKDACMLESVGTEWVKLHDLMRDMAIRITRESPRIIVKAAMGLKALPMEWMGDATWVSAMDSGIEVLPGHPSSPNLTTLLLPRNLHCKSIPNSFFLDMKCLKVLDLSATGILLLPESVSGLTNLRALLLSSCELRELPPLAMLKELRVLDLSYTRLRALPPNMEDLVNLRRLDLSYTDKLKYFSPGVILKLSRLENLSMFKSKWRWSSNSLVGKGSDCKQLTGSSQLTSLALSFEDLPSFISYVRSKHWQVLKSYHLGIGLLSWFVPTSNAKYSVEIQGCNITTSGSFIELPENTQQLAVQGCHDISVLSNLSRVSYLGNIKECYVSSCRGLEFVTAADANHFPNIESLVLRKLFNLKAICSGRLEGQNFVKLKILHIHNCNSLKNLFSVESLQHMQNLEEVEVWNSRSIQEIVEEATDLPTIALPKLRRLYLSILPELKSIAKMVFICNSLDAVDIWNCSKLKRLPFSINHFPSSLKHIKTSKEWWDELEWDEPDCRDLFQPLFNEDKMPENPP
ncbi:hypothetical protein RJ640_004158 [Escallonia rubra]|uniref:Uncharacterized protein n=1 Tax=Escallonia rubra TaxID=112253 RepID=A0AA88QHV0_9ASTE|nr:hypothetical protein RJ640_004158 [Escallonia rubra]